MRPDPFDKLRTAPVEARPSTSAVLSLSKGSTHIPADSATLLARFSERLRDAGVAVSPDQTIRLATLVTLGVPSTVEELYWCARVSLLRSTADIAAFDAVFALVFRGMVDVAESRGDSTQIPLPPQHAFPSFDEEPGANVPSKGRFEASESADSDDVGRPIPTFASSEERLTEVDFARLTTDELAALTPLLRMLCINQPRRLSRRRRRHRRGDRLDVRASLRHSTRSGGDPAVPIRRTRKWTPRRLVALLDISGSMEPHARAYLDLLWGAATRAHAEVFVFGTRLTRLTRALRNANPDLALERADPSVLAQQMVALCRHAHRIVWANPRAAAPGFAPLAAGMAAALPHVDSFISGHSADALAEVVRALGASQPRRSIGIPTVRHCSSRRVSPLVNRI